MYIISHKRKYIFIHLPKVAGNSMKRLLEPINQADADSEFWYRQYFKIRRTGIHLGFRTYPRGIALLKAHATAKQVKANVRKQYFDNYFKFGFVRNPWDRQLSFYNWMLKLNPRQSWYEHQKHVKARKDFNDFMEWYHLSGDRKANFGQFWHVQKDFLFDTDGTQLVDFIGRFENLAEDFEYVKKQIGIEEHNLRHHNKSRDRKPRDYRKAYTDKTAELIAKICKEDIDTFGYTF
jgi:hypothetical protein